MSFSYTHDSTTWHEKQDSEARRKALPQRLPLLTRRGSLVVKVRCTPTFKNALKDTAKRVKNCSVNRLVRKAFRSRRYHFPNLPAPQPGEKATARLTLMLTPEEWHAFKDYAAAWRIPLCRALWLLVARPYTVADRPRSLSHTPCAQSGAKFANSSRSFYAKAAKGCKPSLSQTSYKKEKENDKKKYLDVCPKGGDELKPANGLAEKLWLGYGVKLSVANDLVARYDREEIEAAMELRERRNGAIYNPAGFIVYLLRKGYAQRWAEIKRARQDPEFLASQVKEAVEAAGFPVTVTISECIPFAEFPKARLALPLEPDRAVAILRRIFQTERALPPDADVTDEKLLSHPFERAESPEMGESEETSKPLHSHLFEHEKLSEVEETDAPAASNTFGRAEVAVTLPHAGFVDTTETKTETFQTANPDDTAGETAFAPAAQQVENSEEETEDADRCRRCGKHNSEIPICEDSGLCLECTGYPTQRICYDCGGEFEVAYRERFDALLCRRCYLKRLARSAGITDYEPPPRFPWLVFPESDNESEKQPTIKARESETQRAHKTPLEWLKSLFLRRGYQKSHPG